MKKLYLLIVVLLIVILPLVAVPKSGYYYNVATQDIGYFGFEEDTVYNITQGSNVRLIYQGGNQYTTIYSVMGVYLAFALDGYVVIPMNDGDAAIWVWREEDNEGKEL